MSNLVVKLMSEREDWLEHLANEYKIRASRDGDVVSLKYNQIESPMHEPVVKQCRGMVVDTSTKRVLAWPYNKFWNHGDHGADEIDWATARVLEKLDGSLMVLYWNRGWRVASSGTPTASGAFGASGITFGEAFWNTFGALNMALPDENDRDVCFMLELCDTPNRVVVKHARPRLVLHGARVTPTGAELSLVELADIAGPLNWEVVKSLPIGTLAEALAAADALDPLACEGFVVVDAQHRRVKIKSPSYVALHHLRGEQMTERRAIELWQTGETRELLTHFPEFEQDVVRVHTRLDACVEACDAWVQRHRSLPTRKEYAAAVQASGVSWAAVCFKMYGLANRVADLMRAQSTAALERMLAQ